MTGDSPAGRTRTGGSAVADATGLFASELENGA
jgi:hypothetical protein